MLAPRPREADDLLRCQDRIVGSGPGPTEAFRNPSPVGYGIHYMVREQGGGSWQTAQGDEPGREAQPQLP